MANGSGRLGLIDGMMFKDNKGNLKLPLISNAVGQVVSEVVGQVVSEVVGNITDRTTNGIVSRIDKHMDRIMNRRLF